MKTPQVQMPPISAFADLTGRDLVAPLFRRKVLLFTTLFAVLTIVLSISWVSGPAYSSRMAILVNRERQDPLVSTEPITQMMATSNPVTAEEINSEVELLSSRDVLEKVVLANGLANPPQGFSIQGLLHRNDSRDSRVARAVKTLAKTLKVGNIKNSNLIEVTYKSGDPQQSYGVLKSLGDLYLAKHVAVHRPAGSYEFFAQQTQKYQQELTDAEDKLRKFGQQHSIAAPDEQRTQLAAKVAESVGMLHGAEQSIAGDLERIKNDKQQMSNTAPRSATAQASAPNDKVIQDLNASLIAAQAKRTQLAMKYASTYPLVVEADQEISDAKAALARAEDKRYVSETTDRDPTYELLREDIARSEADLAAQRATLIATKRSIQGMQSEMVNLDQLSISQQDLQREAKADESNYLLYQAKREQERTSNALDVTRISNVAIAVPPTVPVLPMLSWSMILLTAIGSAVALSIGTAYAVDYMDSSFHTPAQVIEMMGIPVVVAVAKKSA